MVLHHIKKRKEMMYTQSPYDILGVSAKDNPSDETIRTAYRRLARKHHPDKGGDEKEFIKIQEAYHVLTHEDERRAYDQMGWRGVECVRQSGSCPSRDTGMFGMNMADVFGGFFHHPFQGHPDFGNEYQSQYHQHHRTKKQSPHKKIQLVVSLKDAFTGTKIMYTHTRRVPLKSVTSFPRCDTCRGKGRVRSMSSQDLPPFIMMPTSLTVCPDCAGIGLHVRDKDMKVVSEVIEVEIPPRCPRGYTVRVQGMTDKIPTFESGDLFFLIDYTHDQQCPFHVRENGDIISTVDIDLAEALYGFSRKIKYLDGKDYTFVLRRYHSLFQDEHGFEVIKKQIGMGMSCSKTSVGDWVIHFRIRLPTGTDTRFFWKQPSSLTHDLPECCDGDETIISISDMSCVNDTNETPSPPHQQHRQHVHVQECHQS